MPPQRSRMKAVRRGHPLVMRRSILLFRNLVALLGCSMERVIISKPQIVYTDGVVGDKGIYTTVRDLYKWDQALYAGKFIPSNLLGMAFTPQSFERQGVKNYGLGWRMQDQPDGTRLIYHNGWWHSYNSVFNRKISDKTTVIILSNHYSQSVYKIRPVWDILYGSGKVVTSEDDAGTDTIEITKKLNEKENLLLKKDTPQSNSTTPIKKEE